MNIYKSKIQGVFFGLDINIEVQTINRSEIIISDHLTSELNKLYYTIKPELKATDIYRLISFTCFELDNGRYQGVLNCLINNKHISIPFRNKIINK